MIDASAQVHAQAVVDDAFVGARTRVWQFASVIRGAWLGADCNVGGCAIVDGCHIGDRCLIGHGAQLHPGLWCSSDVFIGPGAIVCNDRWPRACKAGFDLEQFLKCGMVSVEIQEGVSIGAGAIVLPGVIIGRDVMVAAGAVVVAGVPAAHLVKRDGSVVPIDPARSNRRMRHAVGG